MEIKQQTDLRDCGIIVLKALIEHFQHRKVRFSLLKEQANYGSHGINLSEMIRLGKIFGLALEGYEVDFQTLIKEFKQRFLVALFEREGMRHYVIFFIKKDAILVYDPALGQRQRMAFSKFEASYSQLILTVSPSKLFQAWTDLKQPFSLLRTNRKIFVILTILSIALIALLFVSSMFMRIIFDLVLPRGELKTLETLVIGFAMLVFWRSILSLIRTFLIKHLQLKIQLEILENYFRQLCDVSLVKLNKYAFSDHVRRLGMFNEISYFYASLTMTIVHEFLILSASLIILVFISFPLFICYFVVACLSFFLNWCFQIFNRKHQTQVQALQLGVTMHWMDVLNDISALKKASYARFLHHNLQQKTQQGLALELKVWKGFEFLNHTLTFLNLLLPLLITYFGIKLVFENNLSLGDFLLFLNIGGFFMNPFLNIARLVGEYPSFKIKVGALVEFLSLEQEALNGNGLKPNIIKNLTFRNLEFGFDQPLIKIPFWSITSHTQIFGNNGVGKTTFLKLIMTNYLPKGEVCFNNIDRDFYDLQALREKIFYVSNNSNLPSIRIYDYLTENNVNKIDYFQTQMQKFRLDLIMAKLKIDWSIVIQTHSNNLSVGQRQGILILKFFTAKYDVLLLDEGLENLAPDVFDDFRNIFAAIDDVLVLEISHSRRFLHRGNEVDFAQINQL